MISSQQLSQWIDQLRQVQIRDGATSARLAGIVDEMDRTWVDLVHAELAEGASDRADLPRK